MYEEELLEDKVRKANEICDVMGTDNEAMALLYMHELQQLLFAKKDEKEEYTLAELVAENPDMHPPIVDGLLREQEIANIVSHSKIGKSWLAYSLALSVVTGRPWLGKFPTTPGKVLLIDYELHKATLAHRIPKVAEAMGMSTAEIGNDLVVWPLRGNAQGLGQLQSKFALIKPGDFKLIIIDPKYRLLAADPDANENSNTSETRLYNSMDELGKAARSAIVLIHHTSKGDQSEKRVTDVGSGAGAQSRAADDHLVLRDHAEENCVRLDVAVRSFKPVEPVVLRWDFPLWRVDGDLDPARLATGKEKQQKARDAEAIEIVRKILAENEPLTKNEMKMKTGMDTPRVYKGLQGLSGEVERVEVKRQGRTFDGWTLIA